MSSETIDVIFVCLAVVYAVTSAFIFFRLFKIPKFSKDWKSTQAFYISLLIHSMIRASCFIAIFASGGGIGKSGEFLLISIPDSIYIVTYVLLFWQFLSIFYHSFINITATFLANVSKRPRQSKISMMMLLIIIIWIGLQFVLYLSTVLNTIKNKDIFKETAIISIALGVFVLATMTFLNIKYSGVPSSSDNWNKKRRRVGWTILLWSVTRIIKGSLELVMVYQTLDEGNDEIVLDDYEPNGYIFIITCIIGEIICIFVVLDYAFIMIFELDNSSSAEVRSESNSSAVSLQQPFIDGPKKPNTQYGANRFTLLIATANIPESEVEIIDKLPSRKNGLGDIYKAKFREHTVFYRKIVFNRVSAFVVEEFTQEIDELKTIECENLLPLHGMILTVPTLGIIAPFMNSSLYTTLHEEKRQLDLRIKISIARQIATCITQLHAQEKAHGHLTSHNIMMNDNNDIFLTDLGLHKIKKYAGIVSSYSNKSAWSSPEQLKDKRAVCTNVSWSDDVYSFGMVLWEILTEQEPFPGYSKQKLIQQIVNESYRPGIPSTVHEDLQMMMMSCWNVDPTKRPNMATILKNLQESKIY